MKKLFTIENGNMLELILIDCTRLEYSQKTETEKSAFLLERFNQLTSAEKLKALQLIESEIMQQID
jgi:hypothetical protein